MRYTKYENNNKYLYVYIGTFKPISFCIHTHTPFICVRYVWTKVLYKCHLRYKTNTNSGKYIKHFQNIQKQIQLNTT